MSKKLLWFSIILLLVGSVLLQYYKGDIFNESILRQQEFVLIERFQFLDGTFEPANFEEPKYIGPALLYYPFYKLFGNTIFFLWFLKLTDVIFLALAIYVLSKILRHKELSLLLLAYPFTYLFIYSTALDVFLAVLAAYLIITGKKNLFYVISPIWALFRPEYVLLPLACIIYFRDYKKIIYVFLGVLVHFISQDLFYGNPFALGHMYFKFFGTFPAIGASGMFAYGAGFLISVIAVVIFHIRFKFDWNYIYAMSTNLIYIYYFVFLGAEISKYAYYTCVFLIIKIDSLINGEIRFTKKEIITKGGKAHRERTLFHS